MSGFSESLDIVFSKFPDTNNLNLRIFCKNSSTFESIVLLHFCRKSNWVLFVSLILLFVFLKQTLKGEIIFAGVLFFSCTCNFLQYDCLTFVSEMQALS